MIHRTLRTTDELRAATRIYEGFPEFAFDVEATDHSHATRNTVFWISFAGPGRTDVIPLQHPIGELLKAEEKKKEPWFDHDNLTKTGKPKKKYRTITVPAEFSAPPSQLWPDEAFEILRPLFFSKQRKIGANVKYDFLSVEKYLGDFPAPPYGDIQIIGRLLGEKRVALDVMAKKFLAYTMDKTTRTNIAAKPFSEVSKYSGLDSKITWILWSKLATKLQQNKKLWKVFELEMRVLEGVLHMEREGVLIDEAAMDKLREELSKDLNDLETRIFRAIGQPVNLSSSQQKGYVVYDLRNHEPKEWTRGGKNKKPQPSTTKAALQRYAKDKVVKDILSWGEIEKLLSTYVGRYDEKKGWSGLKGHLLDGRLHANFKQCGADTGRFSCAEPNLQNIPRRGEKAKLIRSMFIAPPGHVLVVADFSQIELRVLAHYTGAKRLIRAFEEDIDPHADAAAALFDKAIADVTEVERDVGKTENFAIPYGAGPSKVAIVGGFGITKAEALLRKHQRFYPEIYRWKEEVIRQCRKDRYVETLIGRRRALPDIRSQDREARGYAERQAVNTIIQGTSADIQKRAMISLHDELPEHSMMILTVHDELITRAPEDHADEIAKLMSEVMESVRMIDIPLKADAKYGNSWQEAKG